jgi:cephalosporin hydroxylase
LIVEDGIIGELGMKNEFHGGPLKAIDEFLRTNQDFEVDRHWCDFFGRNVTFNVNGYLKRVR